MTKKKEPIHISKIIFDGLLKIATKVKAPKKEKPNKITLDE